MGTQVDIQISEIYAKLCPKCKAKVAEIVKAKISDQMLASLANQVLGVEEKKS